MNTQFTKGKKKANTHMTQQCLHPLVIKYIENAKVYIFYKPIKLTDKKGKVRTQIRVQRISLLVCCWWK